MPVPRWDKPSSPLENPFISAPSVGMGSGPHLFSLVTMELLVSVVATRASRGCGKSSRCQNPLAVFEEVKEREARSSTPDPIAAKKWTRCCFLALLFRFFVSSQIKTNGEKRQNFLMELSAVKWMELAGWHTWIWVGNKLSNLLRLCKSRFLLVYRVYPIELPGKSAIGLPNYRCLRRGKP